MDNNFMGNPSLSFFYFTIQQPYPICQNRSNLHPEPRGYRQKDSALIGGTIAMLLLGVTLGNGYVFAFGAILFDWSLRLLIRALLWAFHFSHHSY
jgi:hypothetical protein